MWRREKLKSARSVLMLTLILESVMLSTILLEETSADDVMILPNHYGRKNYMGLGYYAVFGEIENRGSSAVAHVMITATFYDENGNKIGEEIGHPYLEVLSPGRKSPFEVLLKTAAADKVHNYELKVKYMAADPKPEKLKILSSETWVGIEKQLCIRGEIENTGDGKAVTVKIAVSCYDEADRIIAATVSYIAEIGAHKKINYTVVVPEWWITKYIRSYSLYAESMEYAMIPSNFDHIPVGGAPTPSPTLLPTPSPTFSPAISPTPQSTVTPGPQAGFESTQFALIALVLVAIFGAAAFLYRRMK